jgi:hypothetical protein
MATTDHATLVADGKAPAPALTTAAQYRASILGFHAVKEAVLATAWNTLWLPCSLWHIQYPQLLYYY